VGSWPGRWEATRAEALGLAGDEALVDVVRAYLEDFAG
jgi:4-hydroxybutyrate dehydrogenase